MEQLYKTVLYMAVIGIPVGLVAWMFLDTIQFRKRIMSIKRANLRTLARMQWITDLTSDQYEQAKGGFFTTTYGKKCCLAVGVVSIRKVDPSFPVTAREAEVAAYLGIEAEKYIRLNDNQQLSFPEIATEAASDFLKSPISD